MKLRRSRIPRHPSNIPCRDPAPRHHDNLSTRPIHQLSNLRNRLRRRRQSSRSQQSCSPSRNHILQRRKQFHTLIKRPVKRHRQRRRRPHQLSRPLNIHASIAPQQSQHNTVHPKATSSLYRGAHLRKLRIRINKIPATRPHHRKNRQAHPRAHLPHQLHARRHSSNLQRPAQLNPRSSTAFRRNGPLRTLHRNLHDSSARHRFDLIPNFSFPFSNFNSPISFSVPASLTSLL
jgi:hypothetical protein